MLHQIYSLNSGFHSHFSVKIESRYKHEKSIEISEQNSRLSGLLSQPSAIWNITMFRTFPLRFIILMFVDSQKTSSLTTKRNTK